VSDEPDDNTAGTITVTIDVAPIVRRAYFVGGFIGVVVASVVHFLVDLVL
jgi:hypothetical protein